MWCPWKIAPHPVLAVSVVMKKAGAGGVIGLPFTESMFSRVSVRVKVGTGVRPGSIGYRIYPSIVHARV